MKKSILVVGSINMDLVVRAPRHPHPGETILGSDFQTFPGGKGANQAVAAARLDGNVTMIGRVGEDAFGDMLLDTLQKDRVDTRYVTRTQGVSTGVALITVNEAGQNNIVVVPGANAHLTPEDIHAAEPAFKTAGVVLIQLEIPMETVAEAVQVAKKHEAVVVLNPAPAPAQALPADLLAGVDILIPNEHELAMLTGAEEMPLKQAAETIGVDCLIVTLGSKGAQVWDGSEISTIPPHAVKAVDTTAAGDAFAGAFTLALTEGKQIHEAALWGNAAGAAAVTKPGAQPSLPRKQDILALLNSQD